MNGGIMSRLLEGRNAIICGGAGGITGTMTNVTSGLVLR
jgi:hypothetical protein